jgi:predicted transcriptional regulator
MISNEEFKNVVSDFLEKTGMAASAFGKQAKNDPSFVSRIMSGQEVKESGKEKILDFIENYKE